jgi:predicted DNA-binding transcriptional regulator AlpA
MDEEQQPVDDLINMRQASKLIGVAYSTVYRWYHADPQVLAPAKVRRSQGRVIQVLFRRSDVEALRPTES